MNRYKKHRGLRRYYKNLAIKNEFAEMTWLNLDDPKVWFDHWDIHFDNRIYGNNSFKQRKPHLDTLFRHFDILVENIRQLKPEFQLYAILFDYDSRSDALFLHIANPNNSPFPLQTSDLQQTSTLTNISLKAYLNDLTGYEKLYGNADESYCLLFKKSVGRPLQ